MASFENLASMEPSSMFRPTFGETWPSDAFSRETEAFAKALQKSFPSQVAENNGDLSFSGGFATPWLNPTAGATSFQTLTQTPAASDGSVAENENNFAGTLAVSVSSNRRNGVTAAAGGGKITKRKSRASKRATTTFINADPENFRRMVQQVTGVKFGGGNIQLPIFSQVLKPEPQRLGNNNHRLLPTLDTSAFLLDPTHHTNQLQQQEHMVSPTSAAFNQQLSVSVPPPPSFVLPDGGSASAPRFDFGSFCSFPTLESWKAL